MAYKQYDDDMFKTLAASELKISETATTYGVTNATVDYARHMARENDWPFALLRGSHSNPQIMQQKPLRKVKTIDQ